MAKSFTLCHLLVLAIALIAVQSASQRQNAWTSNQFQDIFADQVFYNGPIITMEEDIQKPKFVAIKSGSIIEVSHSIEIIQKFIGNRTKMIDLQGKTLMPGLVDGHSHFGYTAVKIAQGLNISPPPFGSISSIALLLAQIRRYIHQKNVQPNQTIYGFGYSDLDIIERRHPTRYELDSVSSVNPILLQHFSGHIVVANSLALQMANYTNDSPLAADEADRYPNGTLTGVCRQWGILNLTNLFQIKFQQLNKTQIQKAANQYFSCGVTTAQDIVMQDQVKFYNELKEDLTIDVNGYYLIQKFDAAALQAQMARSTIRYKTRGAKFIADGSIQGYTALLTQPYWVPQSMYSDDLTNYTYDDSRSCSTEACGNENYPVSKLSTQIKAVLEIDGDILVHCNGDKASTNMIEAVQLARLHSDTTNEARVIMIHAQTLREDQLDQFKRLRINPSFFPVHLYYWGDKHYNIFLGPTRANRMNPAGSALRRKLKFTIHNDSPIVLAGLFNGVNTFFKVISAAVNRLTSSGRLLDDGTQKISIYQALKALTINGAWQSRQQHLKGSIKVGKVADLIILDQNPLWTEPLNLDTLKVLATIKGGRLVFGSYPSHSDYSEQIKIKLRNL